eukprot:1481435-Pyramimonas_sp.AAC.2
MDGCMMYDAVHGKVPEHIASVAVRPLGHYPPGCGLVLGKGDGLTRASVLNKGPPKTVVHTTMSPTINLKTVTAIQQHSKQHVTHKDTGGSKTW